MKIDWTRGTFGKNADDQCNTEKSLENIWKYYRFYKGKILITRNSYCEKYDESDDELHFWCFMLNNWTTTDFLIKELTMNQWTSMERNEFLNSAVRVK